MCDALLGVFFHPTLMMAFLKPQSCYVMCCSTSILFIMPSVLHFLKPFAVYVNLINVLLFTVVLTAFFFFSNIHEDTWGYPPQISPELLPLGHQMLTYTTKMWCLAKWNLLSGASFHPNNLGNSNPALVPEGGCEDDSQLQRTSQMECWLENNLIRCKGIHMHPCSRWSQEWGRAAAHRYKRRARRLLFLLLLREVHWLGIQPVAACRCWSRLRGDDCQINSC